MTGGDPRIVPTSMPSSGLAAEAPAPAMRRGSAPLLGAGESRAPALDPLGRVPNGVPSSSCWLGRFAHRADHRWWTSSSVAAGSANGSIPRHRGVLRSRRDGTARGGRAGRRPPPLDAREALREPPHQRHVHCAQDPHPAPWNLAELERGPLPETERGPPLAQESLAPNDNRGVVPNGARSSTSILPGTALTGSMAGTRAGVISSLSS